MRVVICFILGVLLTNCQPDKPELTGHIGRPDISPDGTKIAFIYAKDASEDVWEIYTADVNGKNAKQLTYFSEARIKKSPIWSKNGEKIAFHADINDGAQIFVIDADGENLTQLTSLPGYNVEPHWSPNGAEIVFNSIPKEGKVKMRIMNKDGANSRELHNPDGNNWYPRKINQNSIIFTSDLNHADHYDIFKMNQDGSNIEQLTSIKAINWFPEYSPDKTKIVFHSNQDDPHLSDSGDFNLYIMNADGKDIRQITNLSGQEIHAKWHPSGKKLIFEWHNEQPMGLHTLNLSNGEIEKIRLTTD